MGMNKHEAIEWLNAIKEKYIRGGDDYYDRQRRFAIDWAILLLAHDAVPVVRCKDCKHTENMMPLENGNGYMMGDCILRKEDDITVMVWGDDFCSYGERKDND